MNRTREKIVYEIPSQAVYRQQRSTTEHVFVCKLVIEKSISTRNETAHLILLDVSKAFDNVGRKTLANDLRNTILHIIVSLLNVTLSVKCETL